MINKNYIIGGVAIVAVIGGIIFFSSRNSSSVPDASILETGVKNLTRESAAKMIEIYLKVSPLYSKTKRFSYDVQLGNYALRYVTDTSSGVQELRNLEEAGFVKIVEEKKNSYSGGNVLEYLTFDFTDQAKSYFVEREGVSPDDKNIEVALAELVSVEVTGITEPAQGLGVNVRVANYTAKYKATPIGKVIDEKMANEERKSQMSLTLYDDGWRIMQ